MFLEFLQSSSTKVGHVMRELCKPIIIAIITDLVLFSCLCTVL